MTNRQAWCTLTASMPAALLFKEAGWWFLNCAVLGRNVSIGETVNITYPMQFMLFIGNAGGGKSTIQDAVKMILDGLPMPQRGAAIDVNGAGIAQEIKTTDNWFTFSADSGSFESLIGQACKATQFITSKKGVTIGCARLVILLDEFTSICSDPVSTQHVKDFLLTTWSGKSWSRSTYKHGLQEVRSPAINMLACSTPRALQELASRSPIISDGFLSRTLFIYSMVPTEKTAWPENYTSAQLAAIEVLKKHAAKVAGHIHNIQVSPEARAFLEDYVKTMRRMNKSPLLDDYYVRKVLHIKKLALGHHYSEGINDAPLAVADLKAAIGFLDRVEPHMHKPLAGIKSENEYASICDKLLARLDDKGPMAHDEVVRFLWSDAAPDMVTQLMGHMLTLRMLEVDLNGKYVAVKTESELVL